MELEELKGHLKLAETFKSNASTLYSEAIRFCIPNSEFSDVTFGVMTKQDGVYDAIGVIESNKLARKLVNMILPANIQWGAIKTNNPEPSQEEKDTLNLYGRNVYQALLDSNLNKEALGFFSNFNIGTACVKINYSGDNSNPLEFRNMDLAGLKFVEGIGNKPNIVFYMNKQVPFSIVKGFAGESGLKGSLADKQDYDLIDYYEISYFDSKINKYVYKITDVGIAEEWATKEMSYMSFIVCRNMKYSNNIWGIGPCINALPNLYNNNNTKLNIRKAGKAVLKPPMGFSGNIDNYKNLKLALGQITYVGQEGQGKIYPLNTIGNIQPELINSEDDRASIKELFYSSYITADMGQGNPKTAYEWQMRYKEFLEIFYPNYFMIEQEFLRPVFEGALNIMLDENISTMDANVLKKYESKPIFYNRLTDTYANEDTQNTNNFISNISAILGNPAMSVGAIDLYETIKILSSNYKVNEKILKDEQAIKLFSDAYTKVVMSGIAPGLKPQGE